MAGPAVSLKSGVSNARPIYLAGSGVKRAKCLADIQREHINSGTVRPRGGF